MIDELVVAERLIGYETSRPDALVAAAGFVKGWLESRDIEVRDHDHNGVPVLVADVGAPGEQTPCIVWHGHLDVVPGHPGQFEPRVEGDRLIGRGAYDMKGGLAAMMCALKDLERQDRVRVRLVCVPDEESEELDARSTDAIVQRGLGGELPFSRESSEMFDRPSINLGRIKGGDALNKVPDHCTMAVDVRYLPGQDPAEILTQVRSIPDIEVTRTFIHPTVSVARGDLYVRALRDAVGRA